VFDWSLSILHHFVSEEHLSAS